MDSKQFEIEEAEANRFALELLIPTHMILKDLKEIKDIESGTFFKDMMKKYQVSGQALLMRLTMLNLKMHG